MNKYVIGLDYGSDSARAIVVDASTGRQVASSVKYYPRWKEGKYCDPAANRYRQHPLDYIEVLESSVREALAACPPGTAQQVVGIAFDTTGSTPAFTDESGTPLALLPEFAENPNAMFPRLSYGSNQNNAQASTFWKGNRCKKGGRNQRTLPPLAYRLHLIRGWYLLFGVVLGQSPAYSEGRLAGTGQSLFHRRILRVVACPYHRRETQPRHCPQSLRLRA